ncbi:MAG: hemin receptor [Acidobacteria bacterium]|nr:hemin receptor [Acidobacteriota bacterium]
MTEKQIKSVRRTFKKIRPIAGQAAALFYAKLFDLDPKLRSLFVHDLKDQGRKLMEVIEYAVVRLETPGELLPAVRELGRRHVAYGVADEDYEKVGEALIWTLEKALGRDFNAEARAAWTAVYGLLAETMRDGARNLKG